MSREHSQPEKPAETTEGSTPFRILSLNGGGVRALFQAQYLHSISDKHGIGEFWKNFDLIIGTSAGAIVAAALCVGKTPKEIAELFNNASTEIFPLTFWQGIRILTGLKTGLKKGAIFPNEPLLNKLIEVLGKDTVLGKFTKPALAITATELEVCDIRVFSPLTREVDGDERLKEEKALRLVDVVMASTALPGAFNYYSVHDAEIGQDRHYVDGGLWANAPLLAALVLAIEKRKRSLSNIRVVSIGTGASRPTLDRNHYGKLVTKSEDFFDTLFNLSSYTAENTSYEAAKRLIGEDNLLLIDAITNERIDAWEVDKAKAELPKLASEAANNRDWNTKLQKLCG